jgi:hypothetical protein
MSDRAYAKVQAQQKTSSGSSSSSRLLQRTCACGGSPGIDGLCAECRDKRLTLHSSQRALGSSSSLTITQNNSSIQENVSSLNSAIDRTPRFGHDFSRIPVHSLHPPVLQTKLTVNQPGDIYEQEADQVAEQVMRMTNPETPLSDDEGEAKNFLMCKQSAEPGAHVTSESSDGPPAVHALLNSGGGQPLDTTTRAFMEPRFGRDFSQVRVHSDAQAVESAQALDALAYTVGRNVVFGEGQYAPHTGTGRRLLTHELTHVIQQDPSTVRSSQPNSSACRLVPSVSSLRAQRGVIQRDTPSGSKSPDLPQQLYDEAVGKLKGLNKTLDSIFPRVRLNNKVSLDFSPPQGVKGNKAVFELTVVFEEIPGADGQFSPGGEPTSKGKPPVVTWTIPMILRLNSKIKDSDTLKETLFHEGMHMVLYMEGMSSKYQLTAVPQSGVTKSFDTLKQKIRKDPAYRGLVTAVTHEIKDVRKKSNYKQRVDEFVDSFLEEKFVHLQVSKALGTPQAPSPNLAVVFVIEKLNALETLNPKEDNPKYKIKMGANPPQSVEDILENAIMVYISIDSLDKQQNVPLEGSGTPAETGPTKLPKRE